MRLSLIVMICAMLCVGCNYSPKIQFARFHSGSDNEADMIRTIFIRSYQHQTVVKWLQIAPNTYEGFDRLGQSITTQYISRGNTAYYASRAVFRFLKSKVPTVVGDDKWIEYDWCEVEYNALGKAHGKLTCLHDGRALLTANFKHGTLVGQYRTFHENGRRLGQATFGDEAKIKDTSHFGMIGYSYAWDDQGQLLIDIKSDETGQRIYDHRFEDGMLVYSKYPRNRGSVVRRFGSNGKLASYEEYNEGPSKKITFKDDGTIAKGVLSKLDDKLRETFTECHKVPSLKQMQQPTIVR